MIHDTQQLFFLIFLLVHCYVSLDKLNFEKGGGGRNKLLLVFIKKLTAKFNHYSLAHLCKIKFNSITYIYFKEKFYQS